MSGGGEWRVERDPYDQGGFVLRKPDGDGIMTARLPRDVDDMHAIADAMNARGSGGRSRKGRKLCRLRPASGEAPSCPECEAPLKKASHDWYCRFCDMAVSIAPEQRSDDETLLRALVEADTGPFTDGGWTEFREHRSRDFGGDALKVYEKRLAAIRPLIEAREREAYERGRREVPENLRLTGGTGSTSGVSFAARKSIEAAAHNAAIEAAEVVLAHQTAIALEQQDRVPGEVDLELTVVLDAIRALKR